MASIEEVLTRGRPLGRLRVLWPSVLDWVEASPRESSLEGLDGVFGAFRSCLESPKASTQSVSNPALLSVQDSSGRGLRGEEKHFSDIPFTWSLEMFSWFRISWCRVRYCKAVAMVSNQAIAPVSDGYKIECGEKERDQGKIEADISTVRRKRLDKKPLFLSWLSRRASMWKTYLQRDADLSDFSWPNQVIP